MDKTLRETLACGIIVCIFYGIIWWLLGSYFFGLTNLILIATIIIFTIADIWAIHYLIRRQRKSSQDDSNIQQTD